MIFWLLALFKHSNECLNELYGCAKMRDDIPRDYLKTRSPVIASDKQAEARERSVAGGNPAATRFSRGVKEPFPSVARNPTPRMTF